MIALIFIIIVAVIVLGAALFAASVPMTSRKTTPDRRRRGLKIEGWGMGLFAVGVLAMGIFWAIKLGKDAADASTKRSCASKGVAIGRETKSAYIGQGIWTCLVKLPDGTWLPYSQLRQEASDR